MNILIVDDDSYVLELICKKIDWSSLSINEIYTASSAKQAKEIILEQNIHILLTDIEMPGESGLELLEWVRSRNIRLEAMFLTSYAEFEYAKKAIELKSLEYYLKPVDEHSLSKGIASSVKRCLEYEKIGAYRKQSEYLAAHSHVIEEHFWLDLTKGFFEERKEIVWERICSDKLPFTQDHHFAVILFRIMPSLGRDTDEYLRIYRNRIRKMLREFYKDTYYESVYDFTENEGQFGLCLKLEPDICNLIDIQNTAWRLIEYLEKQEHLELYGAVSEITTIDGIYGQLLELKNLLTGLIESDEKVITCKSVKTREKIGYNMPDLEIWETVFHCGGQKKLSGMITDYLEQLAFEKQINSFVLRMFRMDVEQLVYQYLRKNHVEMHKLFDSKEAETLSDLAVQSIEYMKQYADYLIEKSMEYTEMTEKTDSIISQVKEYLDNHYCTAISRNDLADVVYLNPNYLSRLFKREMNTSINSYLIDKRIDKAKSLLEHSDMPVHAVSMEVGYNNFSYFTKLFREKTGQTPNEYRKSMGIREEEYFLR